MSAIIIGSSTSRSINMDTAQGRSIDNTQLAEISPYEVNLFRRFDTDYGSAVTRRCGPTPRYNCHGMTFGSRRTGIFESAVLWQIIQEDNYAEVAKPDVLAGDVILYFDDSGDIEHSGIVISPPSADTLGIPIVCSKWGKYAELIHLGNRCPYTFSNVRYYRVRL